MANYKYDPCYRDSCGVYLRNEWTSFSDIGQIFEDNKFIFEDYMKMEDAYIDAIIFFMECLGIEALKVANLEKHGALDHNQYYTQNMIDTFENIKNGDLVTLEKIKVLSRLILREDLWCKFESSNMYVHFGYDYYLYIGSKNPCRNTIKKIEKTGLFVEAYKSPYLDDSR